MVNPVNRNNDIANVEAFDLESSVKENKNAVSSVVTKGEQNLRVIAQEYENVNPQTVLANREKININSVEKNVKKHYLSPVFLPRATDLCGSFA